jgi:hypothetical protein
MKKLRGLLRNGNDYGQVNFDIPKANSPFVGDIKQSDMLEPLFIERLRIAAFPQPSPPTSGRLSQLLPQGFSMSVELGNWLKPGASI